MLQTRVSSSTRHSTVSVTSCEDAEVRTAVLLEDYGVVVFRVSVGDVGVESVRRDFRCDGDQ